MGYLDLIEISRSGQAMYFIQTVFVFVLILCTGYACVFGGKTGRTGSLIFLVATLLSFFAPFANPLWDSTLYLLFAVDLGCLIALAGLAVNSNRYWPIWACGFQIVAVATHVSTMLAPDIVPRAYQAIVSFWALPILTVMVIGTALDHQYKIHNGPRNSLG
jgi:hypothetical protein